MALNISRNIVASEKGRELVQHGSALFPIACYAEDLSSYSVAWHWHEEFEYVLCTKGYQKSNHLYHIHQLVQVLSVLFSN